MNLEIPVVFRARIIVLALLVFSPGCVEGRVKRLKEVKAQASPEEMLGLVEDDIPSDYLDVYYRRCNKTMYDATDYKKAWDLADKNDQSGGAKLFNKFFDVGRKGRSPQWRQDVCDGWPANLFQCSEHPQKKGFHVCLCLQTKLTKLVVADIVFEDSPTGKQKKIKGCRVSPRSSCHTKTMALKCAHERECVSNVCGVSNIFNFFSNYCFSLFLIVSKMT